MQLKHIAIVAAAAMNGAMAHPGHDVAEEALERRSFVTRSSNLQSKCGKQLAARGIDAKARVRREALARSFREKRGLSAGGYKKRSTEDVLNTDHHSDLTGIDFTTDPSTLFGDNSSCLLQPETTEGPYYVSGEYIRNNITEDQPGVPIVIDMQVIDTNTCEPLANTYVEFWHCNSTGVYGGVVANGNGNSDDASNLDATFLRGIQPTDDNGVVQMATVFPGHYSGRATHIHILTHGNGTVLSNSTLGGSTTSHVGQLFFDQALISEVSAVEPYSSNDQAVTQNADDSILAQEADTTDPVLEYVYAGDSVADGLVTWITVGVDSTVNKSVQAAAYLAADGGHENENAGGMFGGGGAAPSGGMPGGAPPNGSMSGVPMGSGTGGLPGATSGAAATGVSSGTAGTSGTAGAAAAATVSSSTAERRSVPFFKALVGMLFVNMA